MPKCKYCHKSVQSAYIICSECSHDILGEARRLECDNVSLRQQISDKDNEIKKLHARLQISPFGDDKVDELQEACDCLRHRAETAERFCQAKDNTISNITAERDAAVQCLIKVQNATENIDDLTDCGKTADTEALLARLEQIANIARYGHVGS